MGRHTQKRQTLFWPFTGSYKGAETGARVRGSGVKEKDLRQAVRSGILFVSGQTVEELTVRSRGKGK